jgi:hypothetical protein
VPGLPHSATTTETTPTEHIGEKHMEDGSEAKLVIRKFKNQTEADDVRQRVLETFLLAISDILTKQTDVKTQVNAGILEFESFLDALLGGGSHPALEAWLERRKGTPAGDAGELRARRLIVLMTIALERVGLSRAEARRTAAREATAAAVFAGQNISAKTIEHWHERMSELTPRDEQLIATAIATAGTEAKHRLALYFIGHAHFAHNPTAMLVPVHTD